jgi:sigma-B regulation protein RsbU (phosphoserine phosphatase)
VQGQLAASSADLADERDVARLREEFVAILGHDLRNPIAAIRSGTHLLLRTPLNERATRVVGMMQQSATRMAELVSNMLDFARGRLGGGMNLQRSAECDLEPVLQQIVDELEATWPDRPIAVDYAFAEPVDCDPARVSQLFSNLLSNALTHGSPDQPVQVQATTQHGQFELSVANGGEPIDPAALEHLFKPFSRGALKPNHHGLGLGLHIAAEIARAHGGQLSVRSTPEETRFTFRMPTRPD